MTTDVNAAFVKEKTDQIEAVHEEARRFQERIDRGEVEPIGEDRYRVLTGWDAGETFRVQRDTDGRIAQILGQHGLDTTTGQAALYSTVPTWHGLGTVIPGGTTDIDEVLRLARLDWQVRKVPALYEWEGEIRHHDDRFHTVREDTGRALGAVGRDYTVFQNRRVFEFLQDLTNSFDLVWESAGALRDGRRTFVTVRIPQSIVIDRGGLNDEILLYLAAINSHDGTRQSEWVVTPWRIQCGNTERFATRDAVHRWGIRHTSGALDRLNEARRALGLTLDYAKAFEREENQLVRTELLIDQFHDLVSGLWPLKEDASDLEIASSTRRHDLLDGMFREEAKKLGRTLYTAERTITDYLDHRLKVVPRNLTEDLARAQRALEGTHDDLKSKAHHRLLLLSR
ncbi:DUF932 domain-containing protein [Streptomyces sp. NPDC046805]|uniref:DUF932 domain-containing protein n=1 Tax=Streptomyces sp. NPDC046805 TaxID=3155134 RepID=UPI0033C2D84F